MRASRNGDLLGTHKNDLGDEELGVRKSGVRKFGVRISARNTQNCIQKDRTSIDQRVNVLQVHGP
jgi:hypothetical protein